MDPQPRIGERFLKPNGKENIQKGVINPRPIPIKKVCPFRNPRRVQKKSKEYPVSPKMWPKWGENLE